MLEHLKQPNDKTCVHTCIAMLAGVPVQEVIDFVGTDDQGLSTYETMEVLSHFKLSWNLLALPSLMWDCWHLVTVPSLNERAGTHAILIGHDVYGDGLVVLDPQHKRKGRKYYTEKNLGGWSEPFIITGV